MPIQTALAYSSQIVEALVEAHGKGIVHRDLKPGNIMIWKTGVKVLDFGLARSSQEDDESVTSSPMIMGTPAYMAPEQRAGETGRRTHGHLRIRLRILQTPDRRASRPPAAAHSCAQARNNCEQVSGRRSRAPLAIRCRVTAGAGGRSQDEPWTGRHRSLFRPPCAEAHPEDENCAGRNREQDGRSGV